MLALPELQASFFAVVTGQAPPSAGLLAELSSEQGLAIYGHMYAARLAEVVSELCPRTVARLGEALDDTLRELVRRFPPTAPSIAQLVDHLPQVVPAGATAELAALEVALTTVFEAADTVVPSRTEAVSARLVLAPATRLLRVGWSVEREVVVRQPGTLLVYRGRDLTSRVRRLERGEAALLQALAPGATLSELCEIAARRRMPAARVAGALGRWLDDGVVSRAAAEGVDGQ